MSAVIERVNYEQRLIDAAKINLESKGWRCVESFGEGSLSSLVTVECFKDGYRRAWGFFKPFDAWTLAYEAITGFPFEFLDDGLGDFKKASD